MKVKIEDSWKQKLGLEFQKAYFGDLVKFVKKEYMTKQVFPAPGEIFAAFERCSFKDVRVVILGQDPYHGPGQAHGLSFSVQDGVRIPPSLVNIYKEIESDLGVQMPSTGNLGRWADQGVFLLNATLTVVAHRAGSHQKKGWELFTDSVIRAISDGRNHVVFMLWGAYAGRKAAMIDKSRHLILKAPHPSPLSAHRGFFGCKHFSKANEYLKRKGMEPIDW